MQRAIAAGAHGLELDVHVTVDGHLVVAHDDSTRRMTGRRGRICKSSLADLQALDPAFCWVRGKVDVETLHVGESWALRGMGPADPALRIPTLVEVMEMFKGVPLNLEIKSKAVAPKLADALMSRHTGDVLVVSFRDRWLRAFRRRAPHIPTAPGRAVNAIFWLASRVGVALPIQRHSAIQVPLRLGPLRVTDARLVKAAHKRGLAVHVWTLDNPNDMHAAILPQPCVDVRGARRQRLYPRCP